MPAALLLGLSCAPEPEPNYFKEVAGVRLLMVSVLDPAADFIWDSVVEEILGSREKGVHGVRLKNVKSGEVSEFPCQGVFVAIGHQPNTSFLEGKMEMDDKGYLIAREPSTAARAWTPVSPPNQASCTSPFLKASTEAE